MANFRPDVPPEFLESDDETEFEGFRDDEIDNDDLSVNEYSSESESEESASETESEESDEGIDQPQPARPRADGGARRGNQRVPVRIVNWSEKLATENIPAFTENTGPVNVLGRDRREVDFFRLLFPVGLLAWIANETNRFARQVQAVKGRDTRWTETNMDEICVFIGIRIYVSCGSSRYQDVLVKRLFIWTISHCECYDS